MAQFINPWVVKLDGTLTGRELARALRQSISAEEEAVHLYEAYADATEDPLAKQVFQDVADEEKVHVGEFQAVLNRLQPDESSWLQDGMEEVEEMAATEEARVANELVRLAKALLAGGPET